MPAAFPNDPFVMIAGGNGFAQGYANWANDLYDGTCFRVCGLDALIAAHGLLRSQISHDRLLAQQVIGEVPTGWSAGYNPADYKAWSVLGRPQLGRALTSEPQIFDAALMSVLYVVRRLEAAGKVVTPAQLTEVRVYPILFSLDVANDAFFATHVDGKPLLKKLRDAMILGEDRVVSEVFRARKCISERNADAIVELLKLPENGGHACAKVVRRGRKPNAAGVEELLDPNWMPGMHATGAAAAGGKKP